MTVVHARLSELEFELLSERARAEGRTVADLVHEAIRSYLLGAAPDRNDPVVKLLSASRPGDPRPPR